MGMHPAECLFTWCLPVWLQETSGSARVQPPTTEVCWPRVTWHRVLLGVRGSQGIRELIEGDMVLH